MSLFYFEETNINQFTATADFASLHRTFNRAEGNSIGEATPPRTQSPHDPLPVGRTLPRSRGTMRAEYFDKAPVPTAKCVRGKLYPHFILDKKAPIGAKEVILHPLNKLDFVVDDEKSNGHCPLDR